MGGGTEWEGGRGRRVERGGRRHRVGWEGGVEEEEGWEEAQRGVGVGEAGMGGVSHLIDK